MFLAYINLFAYDIHVHRISSTIFSSYNTLLTKIKHQQTSDSRIIRPLTSSYVIHKHQSLKAITVVWLLNMATSQSPEAGPSVTSSGDGGQLQEAAEIGEQNMADTLVAWTSTDDEEELQKRFEDAWKSLRGPREKEEFLIHASSLANSVTRRAGLYATLVLSKTSSKLLTAVDRQGTLRK